MEQTSKAQRALMVLGLSLILLALVCLYKFWISNFDLSIGTSVYEEILYDAPGVGVVFLRKEMGLSGLTLEIVQDFARDFWRPLVALGLVAYQRLEEYHWIVNLTLFPNLFGMDFWFLALSPWWYFYPLATLTFFTFVVVGYTLYYHAHFYRNNINLFRDPLADGYLLFLFRVIVIWVFLTLTYFGVRFPVDPLPGLAGVFLAEVGIVNSAHYLNFLYWVAGRFVAFNVWLDTFTWLDLSLLWLRTATVLLISFPAVAIFARTRLIETPLFTIMFNVWASMLFSISWASMLFLSWMKVWVTICAFIQATFMAFTSFTYEDKFHHDVDASATIFFLKWYWFAVIVLTYYVSLMTFLKNASRTNMYEIVWIYLNDFVFLFGSERFKNFWFRYQRDQRLIREEFFKSYKGYRIVQYLKFRAWYYYQSYALPIVWRFFPRKLLEFGIRMKRMIVRKRPSRELKQLASFWATDCLVSFNSTRWQTDPVISYEYILVFAFVEECIKNLAPLVVWMVGAQYPSILAARFASSFSFAFLELYWDKCYIRGLSPLDWTLYPAFVMHMYVTRYNFLTAWTMHSAFNFIAIHCVHGYKFDSVSNYPPVLGMMRRQDPSLRYPDARETTFMLHNLHSRAWNVKVENYHVRKNHDALMALENHKASIVQLHGYTRIGPHVMKFPTGCHFSYLIQLIEGMRDSPARRMLFLEGKLHYDIYIRYKEVFKGLLLFELHADEAEEKQTLPDETEFLYNERVDVDDFSPVMFDGITEALKGVEEVAFVLDTLRKLYQRDYIGLTLNFGMRATYLQTFFRLISITKGSDLSSLVESEHSFFTLNADEEESWHLDFVPKVVSKSPRVRKILAMGLALAMSPFVNDLAVVRRVALMLDWGGLKNKCSFLSLAMASVSAFYAMLTAAVKKGSTLEDIFGLPDNVYFINRSRELLTADRSKYTELAMVADYQEIAKLLSGRKFLKSDAEISRLKDRLEVLAKEIRVSIAENRVRDEPMWVFMGGEPGTGKTTLIEVLCSMLMARSGRARFLGDTIHYNVSDKFPVETGINQEAVFLVANDIPKNYVNYRNMDMLPFDIVIQKVIDNAKYDPRAADVADKGKMLYALTHFIVTSNELQFSGAEEATKLLRRFQNGISVETFFQIGDQQLTYTQLPPNMEEDRRNDCVRFRKLSPYVKGIAFGFAPTDEVWTLQQFLMKVLETTDRHENYTKEVRNNFYTDEAKCSCGVPHLMHFTERNNLMSRFVFVKGKCDSDDMILKSIKYVSQPQRARSSRYVHESRFRMVLRHLREKSPELQSIVSVPVAYTFSLIWSFLCFMLTAFIYSFFTPSNMRHTFEVFRGACSDPYSLLEAAFIYKPLRETILVGTIILQPRSYDKVRMWSNMVTGAARMRRFFRDNGKIIALAMGSLLIFGLYNRKTEEKPEFRGQAIFQKQLRDPEILFDKHAVIRWNNQQQSRWGKPESTMQIVKPFSVGVGFSDLLKKISHNVRPVSIEDSSGKVGKGFCVLWNTEWVSVNYHFYKNLKGDELIVTIDGQRLVMDRSEFKRCKNSELAMFKNWFDKTVPDITVYLAEDLGSGPFVCHVPYLMKPDQTVMGKVETFDLMQDVDPFLSIYTEVQTNKGECGHLILVSSNNGWCIGGCVAVGYPGTHPASWFSTMTREQFSSATEQDRFPEFHSRQIDLPAFYPIKELSDKAVYRHFDSPLLRPIGTLVAPSRHFKTKFVRTRLYPRFVGKLTMEYSPPLGTSGMHDGEFKSSLQHSFKYLNLEDLLTMKQYMISMLHYLNSACPLDYVKSKGIELHPLSIPEAIFGVPDISIDRITFKTSCGLPWSTMGIHTKDDLFEEVGEEEIDGEKQKIYRLKSCIVEAINKRRALARDGILQSLFVSFTPKDEIRPLKSMLEFKVRDFAVLGADYNLDCRAYFMPIIKFLMAHPEFSECWGEMNAGSKQWTDLAMRLRKHPYYIDLDFSKFDMRHWRLIRVVACFFYLIALRLGYTQEEATYTWYLVVMLEVQVLIYNNDVALKFIGMPSGVIITLILNSVVNSILMRVAFLVIFGALDLFHKQVCINTMGDDNASSVAADIIDRFNVVTIAKVLHLAGYVATPASKANVPKPHVAWEDLVFLKRKFVWSEELSLYLAPIEKDSIYKALCWQPKMDGISADSRLQNVALSAQREAFLHGRAFFDQVQGELEEAFKTHQMEFMYRPLSYIELKREILDGSFRTVMC